jgi:adenylate cyclase
VAVLFIDIVGFTSLCEGMAPKAVVAMLRDFHGRMADGVFEHGGTLDKFIGDSVMATFDTPHPGPHDAANALACARTMLAALVERVLAQAGEHAIGACAGMPP